CFWHGHGVAESPAESLEFRDDSLESVKSGELSSSKCCKIPNTNRDFWVAKIRRNQERDRENYRVLRENGWQVIVIWECQLKPALLDHTMREVEMLLNDNLLSLYKHHIPVPYNTEEEETQLPMAAEE
ncbi:MAG: hypothetical protein IIY87_01655, partial [Bacteroidales bacterium]|nr:hypothetical protein [Bacteroidales bacterium]